MSLQTLKHHWYIASLEVTVHHKNQPDMPGAIKMVHAVVHTSRIDPKTNKVISPKQPAVDKFVMAQIESGALRNLADAYDKRGIDFTEVHESHEMTILSISYLGHMTAEELGVQLIDSEEPANEETDKQA